MNGVVHFGQVSLRVVVELDAAGFGSLALAVTLLALMLETSRVDLHRRHFKETEMDVKVRSSMPWSSRLGNESKIPFPAEEDDDPIPVGKAAPPSVASSSSSSS